MGSERCPCYATSESWGQIRSLKPVATYECKVNKRTFLAIAAENMLSWSILCNVWLIKCLLGWQCDNVLFWRRVYATVSQQKNRKRSGAGAMLVRWISFFHFIHFISISVNIIFLSMRCRYDKCVFQTWVCPWPKGGHVQV